MSVVILGVGNVLEEDDGVGIYAAAYLNANYVLSDDVQIIDGGVEGINLLNLFLENDHIIILDTINLDDSAGSIYNIPSYELSGYGLNSGGAHEVGVMQCLDMIELMGESLPSSNILGIVPKNITFRMGLSDDITARFETYITEIIGYLQTCEITVTKKVSGQTLLQIIDRYKYPTHILNK